MFHVSRPLLCFTVVLLTACVGQVEPDPRFTLITAGPHVSEPTSSGGVAWADADGDGDPDLYVPGGYDVSSQEEEIEPHPNRLFRNLGDGTFELADAGPPSSDAGFSSGASWADIDNDGDPDLFVPNEHGADFLYRNDGDWRFTPLDGPVVRTGGLGYHSTWGDVDNDGLPDLFICNGGLSGQDVSRLFRNLGGGEFEQWSIPGLDETARAAGASFVDVDTDGRIDLIVDGDPRRFWRNGADGLRPDSTPAFISSPFYLRPALSSAWGDYDNDGDMDVCIVHEYGERNRLYRNDDGRFTPVEDVAPVIDGGYSVHALWGDLDNNGWLDLVVVNWGSPTRAFLNGPEGFQPARPLGDLGQVDSFAAGAALADADGDGDLDLYVANWPNQSDDTAKNAFYRNDSVAGNWLVLDLVGTESNRDALGARVTATVMVEGQLLTMAREVRSAEGWRGQSARSIHLGLGSARRVRDLEIRWPSGRIDHRENIVSGQRLEIREGSSP
ncbi:CRTAC1 family protein [Gemmatimonadota bacterium]